MRSISNHVRYSYEQSFCLSSDLRIYLRYWKSIAIQLNNLKKKPNNTHTQIIPTSITGGKKNDIDAISRKKFVKTDRHIHRLTKREKKKKKTHHTCKVKQRNLNSCIFSCIK